MLHAITIIHSASNFPLQFFLYHDYIVGIIAATIEEITITATNLPVTILIIPMTAILHLLVSGTHRGQLPSNYMLQIVFR